MQRRHPSNDSIKTLDPDKPHLQAVELTYLPPLAYRLRPEPDLDNVGWLGGLIDHPFRYSDDINRFLIFLGIALLPGRLAAIGLVDFFRALR